MLKLSKRNTILIGLSIILVGFALITREYLLEKKSKAFDHMNNKIFVLSDSELPDIQEEAEVVAEIPLEEQVETPTPQAPAAPSQYIGNLEIPKIGFKRGFVGLGSKDNHIDKNITVINGSNYPNIHKGNFIIAGHSGSGYLAFFKDLHKVDVGDTAVVNYQGVKYTYKFTKKYYQPRIGKIGIFRDYNKTSLTLITCTVGDKSKQTVFIAELVSNQAY